jgi:hypothetical protein
MEKRFDSSCIVPPFGRMLSMRLIIKGIVVVIVPFFMLLLFKALGLLTLVFNPTACISTMDDIALLQWSETAC